MSNSTTSSKPAPSVYGRMWLSVKSNNERPIIGPRMRARAEADALWEPVYLSEDAQEGPRAFREKRAPRWQGR